MNYSRIYNNIIALGKTRTLPEDTYTEKHHVIPKCLGGDNSKDNLVKLTAREHYVVHWLLVKIYPGNPLLIYAWNNMCSSGTNKQHRYTSHTFKYAREHLKIISIGRTLSVETKSKISIKSKAFHQRRKESGADIEFYRNLADKRMENGYRHSDETKQKIGARNRGKVITTETRLLTGATIKHKWQNPVWRDKVIAARVGYTHSDETIEKMRKSNTEEVRAAKAAGGKKQKGKPKPIATCPHCGVSGGSGIMKRWHFNRCKKYEL